jgi:hypothetical protein
MNIVMSSDAMHGDLALGPEGRRYPRSEDYQARSVDIEIRDYASPVFADSQERSRRMRTINGTLIDLNQTGLGVKTLCPLAVGSIVLVGGELHSPESCVRIDARARVAHCRCQPDESFRVGLNFLDIKQQDLECSHDPGFSLEGD